MTYRQRRRINWVSVISLLIALVSVSMLMYDRYGVPKQVYQLPFFPRPTPTATPVIDDGTASFDQANQLFDQGKLDDAGAKYQETIATIEKAYTDLVLLADKLTARGNAEEAAARRNDAQNALLRASLAYTRWCKILALRQKAGEAITYCNRAIEINSRSPEAYAFLALAYDRNNEFDKAIAAAQRAIDLDPNYAEGYAFLAEALADKSPFDKRNLETAIKAVNINGNSGFAQRNLGWVYESEAKYAQAAQAYARATELMPYLSYFYMDLCRVQKVRGLWDDAITACQKATEVDPQNAEAYDRLGQLYFDRFDNQKALEQFQKAVSMDPSYPLAYGHMGWVYYFRLNSWEKAVEAFQKALELGENRLSPGTLAEFYTELGWSYYRLARCADARPLFDKAVGLMVRNPGPGSNNIIQQAQDGLRACEGKK